MATAVEISRGDIATFTASNRFSTTKAESSGLAIRVFTNNWLKSFEPTDPPSAPENILHLSGSDHPDPFSSRGSVSKGMEVIRGPVLPRCAAPALTSDARISSQLLRRVHMRRRACGGVLQGDYYGVSPRFFGVLAQRHSRSGWPVCCSYGSSSDGDGTAAANFDASGEEFVDSSVIEAVELRSVSDGFVIKLRDGRNLRCVQNNPRVLRLRDSAPHHAIVLKMEDGSNLLLPIIVMETPSIMLLAALRNIRIPRPTIYNVVKEMTEMMGYRVRLVRITEMVHDAYYSRLYLSKNGNEEETISFDLKPSDAINIAFRCKVPIQVNKSIAYNNGLKIVQPKPTGSYVNSDQIQYTRLDKPGEQPCFEAQEFDLVRSMLIAAVEERYKDAAQYRDQLLMFRAKKKNRI